MVGLVDHSGMKLGKRAAIHVPRFDSIVHAKAGVQRAPVRLDKSHIEFQVGLYGNDLIGDCTAVTLANAAQAQAATQGFAIGFTTEEVVGFYSKSTGYDPTNPASDQGGIIAQVYGYQSKNGFRGDSQTPFVGAWSQLEGGDRNAMALAMTFAGQCPIGVNLVLADQTMEVWDSGQGDQTPWGGHSTFLWDYTGLDDDDIVRVGTWGNWKKATWRWVQARCDEAYLIVWRQLLGELQSKALGVDWLGLTAENIGWISNLAISG